MQETKICPKCGAEIFKEAEICVKCGCRQYDVPNTISFPCPNTRWLATFLFCLLLGIFGAHRFYVGKKNSAIAMLLITLGLGWIGIGIIISEIWAIIDLVNIICGNFTDKDDERIRYN